VDCRGNPFLIGYGHELHLQGSAKISEVTSKFLEKTSLATPDRQETKHGLLQTPPLIPAFAGMICLGGAQNISTMSS